MRGRGQSTPLSDLQTAEIDLAEGVALRGLGRLDRADEHYGKLGGFKGPPRVALNYALFLGHYRDKPGRASGLLSRALRRWKNSPTKDRAAAAVRSLDGLEGRRQEAEAQAAKLESRQQELARMAKGAAKALAANIESARGVFERHRDVEQDPSWAEVFEMQVEACTFAIEAEDFYFVQEQAKYLDEFMLQYLVDGIERDPGDWRAVRREL